MKKMRESIELTIKEAAEFLNVSQPKVREYIKQDILLATKNGITHVKKQDAETLKRILESKKNNVSPFGLLCTDYDESYKFLDNFDNPHDVTMSPRKFATGCKYLASNKGRIINLTLNHELKQKPADHGYLQVCLRKNNKNMPIRIHRAVAFAWCPNGKFKSEVHHINGIKTDNRSINLIHLTNEEHNNAHVLMDMAKQSNDWHDYDEFIREMQIDNAWKEEIKFVIDATSKLTHYIYVSKEAYEDLNIGKRTLDDLRPDEIRGEFIE